MPEDGSDIIIVCAFHRAVGRPGDVARGGHVPEGDVVCVKELYLVVEGDRDIFSEKHGDDFPEAILRMSVIEVGFSRSDGWKAAQNENARLRVIKGGKGVKNGHGVCKKWRSDEG